MLLIGGSTSPLRTCEPYAASGTRITGMQDLRGAGDPMSRTGCKAAGPAAAGGVTLLPADT